MYLQNVQFGVNTLEIKNVAKHLFHEIIDEMCLSVANQAHIVASVNGIFIDVLEESIRENLIDVTTTVLNDVREEKLRQDLHRKKLEQERKQMELLEREEKRKRELKILKDKQEQERLKKKKEIELMNLRIQLSSQICEELCETVITSDTQKLVRDVVRETRLEQWSNEELNTIEHSVVLQNVRSICKSAWKESKLKMCMKIRRKVILLRLKKYFGKWQDRKLLQLRFKILTQTFPTVPIFRVLTTQVHELLPKQPQKLLQCKSDSFAIDSNVTASIQTPMEQRQRQIKFNDILSISASNIQKQHDDASRLPFCAMLHSVRMQHGLQNDSITWKISLRMQFSFPNNTVESWLSRLFFPSGKKSSIFSDDQTVRVSCQIISDDNTKDDLFGSSSVVLCLNKPSSEGPSQEYWESVRDDLELLVSSRSPLPVITLLVVTVGWNCCQETLNAELGITLLSFAFSRWAVCNINDDEEYILENYATIKSGIQFLFEEMPILPKLTTMTLRELVEDTLMNKYILPVSQYMSLCKKIFQVPMGPCSLVRFYNFVIESLANIISCDQLGEISWPPVKTFSNCEKDLWQGRWNSEDNLKHKFKTTRKCKLPPFPENEITTITNLCRAALDYGNLACPDYPAITSIIEERLKSELYKFGNEIYLDDSFYATEKDVFILFDWHSILDVIICQHLTSLLYQQREVGNMMVTFLAEDLNNMDKYQEFENLKGGVGYTALEVPKLEETVVSVRPQFSEIIDDQFSHLDYSIPSPNAELSGNYEKPDTTVTETMKLLKEAKLERELSSITTERLSALASDIEMAL